ncbi:MAG: PAS domain S-box protein [Deltaproteobacteria bacterium]|nr:PAS domain S-box protein [Deltaproteobacteria bacterium]
MSRGVAKDAFFENGVVGFGRFDLESQRLEEANEAFVRLLGFADRAVCLREFPRPIPLDLQMVRQGESVHPSLITGEGRTLQIHVRGFERGVDFVVLDATDQSAAIAAVRESEDRFRALVEGGFEGLSLTVDGVIVEANQAVADMLGISRAELVGLNALRYAAPESIPQIAHAIQAGIEEPYETIALRHDGTRFPVEVRGRNTTFRGKKARVTAYRDLTPVREAERELRRSEAKYRELAELLPVVVAEVDPRGCLEFVNKTGLTQLRYTEQQIIGRRVEDVVIEADHARLRDRWARRLAGEQLDNQDYGILRGDGTVVPMVVHADPVMRDGQAVGMRAALVDVSERKQAEEERRLLEARAQEARRLESLGLLAGRIAHDFNNILVGILGNASLALAEGPDGAPIEPHLRSVLDAATRAAELARQLLTYGGRTRVPSGTTDPSETLRTAVDQLRLVTPPGVELRLELEPTLPRISGDDRELVRIVESLVANAVDSGARLVTLRGSTDHAERAARRSSPHVTAGRNVAPYPHVVLEVEDDGTGLDDTALARVFEPYATGRGLGLAAVLGIVRNLGGSICVEAKPGNGTNVSLCLPADSSEPERIKPVIEKSPHSLSGRVLLIDDDPLSLNVLTRMVQHLGLDPIPVIDGAGGLEALTRDASIRIVVLDMNMPGLSGARVLTKIRETHPDVPVLLSSGYDERDAATLVERHGPLVSFIQKPFRLADLEGALRRLVTA